MQTINGIYNNINESTYFADVNNYRFYFSSPVYRKKFIFKLGSYIEENSNKLNLKFKTMIDSAELLTFALYTSIEKRGFRVEYGEKVLKETPLFQIKTII